MPRLLLTLVLLASACGSGSTTPATTTKTSTPKGTGDVGAICGCGRMAHPDGQCVAVDCKAPLVCGYGCGVDGCDSTCMTQETFEQSQTIP